MSARGERTLYREVTPWPGWVRALYWGSMGGLCFSLLAGWDVDLPLPARVLVVAIVAAGTALIGLTVSGLTVLVRETHLLVHLGRVPLLRTRVPYERIVSIESVRYRPIREFGGWGIRGTRRRRIWSARGDRAVQLGLTDGRQLLIGSDHPQRLEERIRAAVGDRLRRR